MSERPMGVDGTRLPPGVELIDIPDPTPEEIGNTRSGRQLNDRTNFLRAKKRREVVLDLIGAGASVNSACAQAGWTNRGTYHHNRREYPEWAKAVDLARAKWKALDQEQREPDAVPDDFQRFVTRYFTDRRPHQEQQLKIAAKLDQLGPRDIFMFLIWPEAGKTSTFEDYICRHLALNPDHRFRIISEAQDLSKRIVGTCSRRFSSEDDYPAFINKFGPFYEPGQERSGKPWTTEQITVFKNSGAERDRSLVASSWSSAVYGSRIDTLIIDDVQSQKNYGQSEEIFSRIRGTFFNRGLEMRTLIVGTRIGPGDFYERMLDAGLVTEYEILPAANRDGEPSVPEFWEGPASRMLHNGGVCCKGFRQCPKNNSRLTSKEYMELIRHQSGEDTWWAAYQQNPSTLTRTTFGELIDRCLDRNRTIGQFQSA